MHGKILVIGAPTALRCAKMNGKIAFALGLFCGLIVATALGMMLQVSLEGAIVDYANGVHRIIEEPISIERVEEAVHELGLIITIRVIDNYNHLSSLSLVLGVILAIYYSFRFLRRLRD